MAGNVDKKLAALQAKRGTIKLTTEGDTTTQQNHNATMQQDPMTTTPQDNNGAAAEQHSSTTQQRHSATNAQDNRATTPQGRKSTGTKRLSMDLDLDLHRWLDQRRVDGHGKIAEQVREALERYRREEGDTR